MVYCGHHLFIGSPGVGASSMAHNAHTLINLFVFSLIQLSFVTGTSAKNSERQREKQFFLPYGDFSRLKQKTQHIMAPRMLFSPELNFTT